MQIVASILLAYVAVGVTLWLLTGGPESSAEYRDMSDLGTAAMIGLDIVAILLWPLGVHDWLTGAE